MRIAPVVHHGRQDDGRPVRSSMTSAPVPSTMVQGGGEPMSTVLVTGAGGFIGGHLVARLRAEGVAARPRRRPDPARRVAPVLRRRGQPVRGPPGARRVPQRLRGRRHRLQPRRGHGRHGVHREQQGAVHALGADHDPHARGGAPGRRAAVLLLVVGLRVRRPASRSHPRSSRSGRRTPIRPCRRTATGGRSCSASAWPALLRGLRPRDPRRPLSQRLRASRNL